MILKGPWQYEPEDIDKYGNYDPPRVFSVADPDNPQLVCEIAVRKEMAELGQAIALLPELIEAFRELMVVFVHSNNHRYVKNVQLLKNLLTQNTNNV